MAVAQDDGPGCSIGSQGDKPAPRAHGCPCGEAENRVALVWSQQRSRDEDTKWASQTEVLQSMRLGEVAGGGGEGRGQCV